MKGKKGFTLIELIVVMAIIAILAAVTVPTTIHFVNKAETEKRNATIQSIGDRVFQLWQKDAKLDGVKAMNMLYHENPDIFRDYAGVGVVSLGNKPTYVDKPAYDNERKIDASLLSNIDYKETIFGKMPIRTDFHGTNAEAQYEQALREYDRNFNRFSGDCIVVYIGAYNTINLEGTYIVVRYYSKGSFTGEEHTIHLVTNPRIR